MKAEIYPVIDVEPYDGDTIRCRARMTKRIKLPVDLSTSILGVEIELESAEIILRGMVPLAIRVEGVDTPEIRGEQREAGEIVKAAVLDWFAANGPTEILFACRDKYAGRTVGDFYPRRGGESLAKFLLREKLAKPYDGGRKEPWTKQELDAIIEKAK